MTIPYDQDIKIDILIDVINKLPSLRRLEIENNHIFIDKISKSLENLTELESLTLVGNGLTDVIGDSLEKLTKLKRLSLSGGVTDAIGESIKKMTELKYLNLRGCKKITWEIGPYIQDLNELEDLLLPSTEGFMGCDLDKIDPYLEKLRSKKLKFVFNT